MTASQEISILYKNLIAFDSKLTVSNKKLIIFNRNTVFDRKLANIQQYLTEELTLVALISVSTRLFISKNIPPHMALLGTTRLLKSTKDLCTYQNGNSSSIKPRSKHYKRLLNKPCVNEVTLTGKNPFSKCCQPLDFWCTFLKGLDLLKKKTWGL